MPVKKGSSVKDVLQSAFASGVILLALAVSIFLFIKVMGNPINFEGLNPEGRPIPGSYLGIIYKGGFIVPLLMTVVTTLVIFTIERLITL